MDVDEETNKKEVEDLYAKLKFLERQEEFLDIQVDYFEFHCSH